MLRKTESEAVKLRGMIHAQKRVIRTVDMRVARTVQNSAHVLRIAIFLGFAKDLQSVLMLYGVEDSSGTERKTAESELFE